MRIHFAIIFLFLFAAVTVQEKHVKLTYAWRTIQVPNSEFKRYMGLRHEIKGFDKTHPVKSWYQFYKNSRWDTFKKEYFNARKSQAYSSKRKNTSRGAPLILATREAFEQDKVWLNENGKQLVAQLKSRSGDNPYKTLKDADIQKHIGMIWAGSATQGGLKPAMTKMRQLLDPSPNFIIQDPDPFVDMILHAGKNISLRS